LIILSVSAAGALGQFGQGVSCSLGKLLKRI
jgi:hypothetical protein